MFTWSQPKALENICNTSSVAMIFFRFILKEKEKCDRGTGGSWTMLLWHANITEFNYMC